MRKSTSASVPRAPLGVRFRRDMRRNRCVYLMMAPVIVYFLMFKYFPMAWLSISLYDFKLLKGLRQRFVAWSTHRFLTARNFWTL